MALLLLLEILAPELQVGLDVVYLVDIAHSRHSTNICWMLNECFFWCLSNWLVRVNGKGFICIRTGLSALWEMASLAGILWAPCGWWGHHLWRGCGESQPGHQAERIKAFFCFMQDKHRQRVRESKEGLAHLHQFSTWALKTSFSPVVSQQGRCWAAKYVLKRQSSWLQKAIKESFKVLLHRHVQNIDQEREELLLRSFVSHVQTSPQPCVWQRSHRNCCGSYWHSFYISILYFIILKFQ